ncbi:DUF721 domain-containing protein [candidate division WOR-3 bacterium]|nr:DUF721 domain-containing protein [candidate division WOR-3 bacterium]
MSKKTRKTSENRYRKTLCINDIIFDVLDGILSRSEEGVAGAVWREIVGPPLSLHTKPISSKDGILTVEVRDPAWRQQLEFLKEDLKTKLNKRLSHEMRIKKIRFVKANVFR